jgi:glycyl-tRNA synthetase
MLSFQEVILKLQDFWAAKGCVIWQPYYSQLGAGTMNPATFLRVLGPEPWHVAYVEPSIRPDDGRYGENPNRFQQHYQFQVILKPDPGDPQELYLRSLEALGIDARKHDIRFVEDNWEAPVLGAWGLGWEVWLDGQEITQFTYFQQAAGKNLDPVSVEITYGIERIVMALQEVEHFRDIQWVGDLTYGDLNLVGEQEHSRYYFETADVERLKAMYDEFEAESASSLKAGLVLPAYDYLLKCSHTFNVLDARGAIGVTERASFFGRMRNLARDVGEAYLGQREQLGYPLARDGVSTDAARRTEEGDEPAAPTGDGKKPEDAAQLAVKPTESADFLLEIGTEELPSADLEAGLKQLREAVPTLLKEGRLPHGELQIWGTPRRMVVYLKDLAPAQEEQVSIRRGPPEERAYDADGKATEALLGFAKGNQVELSDIEVQELKGGRYVVAEVTDAGRLAGDFLLEALPELLDHIRFNRPMRWNSSGVAFSRPIRWLVALHGSSVIPFEYAGLTASRNTRGLRADESPTLSVADSQGYFKYLDQQEILLQPEQRQQRIWEQVSELADQAGGEVSRDRNLLTEVTNLVECPSALLGEFDKSFLELPNDVLISVMKKHQRYFPVENGKGGLQSHFIAVGNGANNDQGLVRAGNEHVIRARFADAAFFVQKDSEKSLEMFNPLLSGTVFQADLGTMLDKVDRLVQLVPIIASKLNLSAEENKHAKRAAQLSKADLATQMVVEMTSLQGSIGREYAHNSGEAEGVAQALFEQYLPRHAGDSIPETKPGIALGIADRLDSLMGLFAVGLEPTGTRDPYALRRLAIGLVQILTARELTFDLEQGLSHAAKALPVKASPEVSAACLSFIIARQRQMLLDQGHAHDVVEAVLAAQGKNPTSAGAAVDELENVIASEAWLETLHAFSRCARITRDLSESLDIDEAALKIEQEKDLYQGLLKSEEKIRAVGSVKDFLKAFDPLIPLINAFFDDVLVMDEDQSLRQNRLALMQRIVRLSEGAADLSKLEGF